jgi:hypothetical protein
MTTPETGARTVAKARLARSCATWARAGLHLGGAGPGGCLRLVERLIRQEAAGAQLARAPGVRRGKLGLRPGVGERRLALLEPGAEQRRVELKEKLAGLHPVVEVGMDARDRAGDLDADVDDSDRVDRAVGGDRFLKGAAHHGRGFVAGGRIGPQRAPPPEPEGNKAGAEEAPAENGPKADGHARGGRAPACRDTPSGGWHPAQSMPPLTAAPVQSKADRPGHAAAPGPGP